MYKQSSCRWFEIPWHSCDVIVMVVFSLFTCRKMRSFILQNACKFGLPEAVTEATRLFNNAIEQAGSGNTYVECQWYISKIRSCFISHCYFNCHYRCLHEVKLLNIGYDLKNIFIIIQQSCLGVGGYIGFTPSVRLSVRPICRVRSEALCLFHGFYLYVAQIQPMRVRCIAYYFQVNRSKVKVTRVIRIFTVGVGVS